MDEIVGWLITAAYFTAAVIYARARIRYWARTSDLLQPEDAGDRGMLAFLGVLVGLVWPLAILWNLASEWLVRPVVQDLERIQRLEADLAAWQAKQHHGSAEEQRMASDIVESLKEVLAAAKGNR